MEDTARRRTARLSDAWATRPARPREGRMVAGVAAALGERYVIDPVLVRVGFATAAIFGPGIPLYLVGCAVLPDGGSAGSSKSRTVLSTVLLIGAAAILVLLLFGGEGGWLAPLMLSLGLLALLHLTRGGLRGGATGVEPARGTTAPDALPDNATGGSTAPEGVRSTPVAATSAGPEVTATVSGAPGADAAGADTDAPDAPEAASVANGSGWTTVGLGASGSGSGSGSGDGSAAAGSGDGSAADGSGDGSAADGSGDGSAETDSSGSTGSGSSGSALGHGTASPGPDAATAGGVPPATGDRSGPDPRTTPVEPVRPAAATPVAGRHPTGRHPAGPPRSIPPSWDPLGAAPFAWDLPDLAPDEPQPAPARSSRITAVTLGLALLAGGAAGAAALTVPGVVAPATVPAAALAVIGVGLVVGAFRHAGRWLLPFAAVLAVATWLVAALPWADLRGGVGTIADSPSSAAAVSPEYRRGVGDVALDLSGLDLRSSPGAPQAAVRTTARVGIGSIAVTVPRDADVVVRGSSGLGDVTVDGQSRSGSSAELTVVDNGPDGPGGGRIELDAHAALGSVTVGRE